MSSYYLVYHTLPVSPNDYLNHRKLYFANFLEAMLELAMMIYHQDSPIDALSKLLSSQILGLFDQTPGFEHLIVIRFQLLSLLTMSL